MSLHRTFDGKGIDLQSMDLTEMLRCSRELRAAVGDGGNLEERSNRVVRFFYDAFRADDTDSRQCVLVRLYKTHRYAGLGPAQQEFARAIVPSDRTILPSMQCLVLVATAGDEPEWNDRSASHGHQAIPLPSASAIGRAPMIARLFESFGVDLDRLVGPDLNAMQAAGSRTYDVFYVENAEDSPFIPAQSEFVKPHGVKSVIGFGGVIDGDLFSVILFCNTRVTQATANRFRNIALDVKGLLLGNKEQVLFDSV